MATISARVPDELEEALQEYVDAENLDRSTAVRKLLTEQLEEWRRERALEMLEDGEVTFSRAAEMADVSAWELAALAEQRDVRWVDEHHRETRDER